MNTLFVRRGRNYKIILWAGLIVILTLGLYDTGTRAFSQSSTDATKRFASYFTDYSTFTPESFGNVAAVASQSSAPQVATSLLLPPNGPTGSGNAMAIAEAMNNARFGAAQWPALKNIWMRESGFNPNARNRVSGACGIPQALPCSKIPDMSTVGQIDWGLSYIKSRYGTPNNAWAFWQAHHWY